MFGKIAKFFKKSAGKQSDSSVFAAPTPMPEPQAIGRPKFAVPGMDVLAPEAVAVAEPDEAQTYTGSSIQVSFSSILDLLPKELHGKSAAALANNRSGFNLPKAVALEQLPRGAVKIALADLRRVAPPGMLATGAGQESKLIDLPLREILQQLHPEAFARRAGQNRITVPDEVSDLFGSKGERLTEVRVVDKTEARPAQRTPANAPAAAAPAAPAPRPDAPAQPIRLAPTLAQQLQAAAPSAAPAAIPFPGIKPAQPAAPAAPAPAPGPSMSAVPKVAPVAAPQVPRAPALPTPAAPAALPPNAIKFPTSPVPVQAPAPAPAAPRLSGEALSVSIATINQQWPESLRAAASAAGATDVEIPHELIDAALKLGRVEFQWQQVATWLRPAPQGDVALDQGNTLIEMPLNVIAPLYLQKSKYKAKKSSVPEGIPDLFSSKGEKLLEIVPPAQEAAEEEEEEEVEEIEAEADAETVVPVGEPITREPDPAPVPARADGPRPQNLSELFGEPEKKNWTPNEIVHKTIALPGVTGALIALQDGLLVAGCMPPPWKTETIAAFIPQIFGRLTQYTKELQMGDVRTVSFGVESGTLQIFNAGIIYFGALGKQGATIPVDDLTLIAHELSRHTK